MDAGKYSNITLEECMDKRLPPCSEQETSHASVHKYFNLFCGFDKMCNANSNSTLSKAMHNVEKYFGVIGLTEDYMETLNLLEYTYPQYFTGLVDEGLKMPPQNVRKNKPKTSQRTADLISSYLHLNYEFYYFIRKRFYQHVCNMKKTVAASLHI